MEGVYVVLVSIWGDGWGLIDGDGVYFLGIVGRDKDLFGDTPCCWLFAERERDGREDYIMC